MHFGVAHVNSGGFGAAKEQRFPEAGTACFAVRHQISGCKSLFQKAIKTKMQTSEAFAFWKGRAAEWTSFRIYAEARDMELARTSGAYAPCRSLIARVSAQYFASLLFFLHTFSGAAEKVCLRSKGDCKFAREYLSNVKR